ncbi:hypothetical protein [Pseudobacteriovorax antillogorgiicola]|uniref:Concanavalin A-like lectin/glucanases superfamily protein n=1 Tax=Pseudobacteriovorax antillogorgiicola TaxID=1513793 RepID=A0A1Y6BJC3_9BACT|nr:hypothetical protein [Pseudobacteriovorax antillogorgiicola]TCS55417.1 hypothetical protein EDD56_105138 [Pseudobacteriovorax antillogorgiicola]SMF12633.1 hypothetical protein SAMN06296036_105186 [Pseudobacteriovorax antillogorgiicola]
MNILAILARTALWGALGLCACHRGSKLSESMQDNNLQLHALSQASLRYWISERVTYDFSKTPQEATITAQLRDLESGKNYLKPQVEWQWSSRYPSSLVTVQEKSRRPGSITLTLSGPKYELVAYINQSTLVALFADQDYKSISVQAQPKLGYTEKGLLLWLDAQDHSTLFADTSCKVPTSISRNKVHCWQDKKNKFSALQADGKSAPSLVQEGIHRFQSIAFDGVDDFLKGKISGFQLHHTPHTIAMVIMEDHQDQLAQHILRVGRDSVSTTNKELRFTSLQNGEGSEFIYSFSRNDIKYRGLPTKKPQIILAHYNGGEASPRNKTLIINGHQQTHIDQVGRDNGGNLRLDPDNIFSLGSFAFEDKFLNSWKGKMGEIMIFNRKLTKVELDMLQEYFRAKWNF